MLCLSGYVLPEAAFWTPVIFPWRFIIRLVMVSEHFILNWYQQDRHVFWQALFRDNSLVDSCLKRLGGPMQHSSENIKSLAGMPSAPVALWMFAAIWLLPLRCWWIWSTVWWYCICDVGVVCFFNCISISVIASYLQLKP